MNRNNHQLESLPGKEPDRTTIISAVDNQIGTAALVIPTSLAASDETWLTRFRRRRQQADAERKRFAGEAEIAMKRQLALMNIAAEAVILMGKNHWDCTLKIHGARNLQVFSSLFLQVQDTYMEDLVAATIRIYNRASKEAERIETSGHPEFVMEAARNENLHRFKGELNSTRDIGDRIGQLLATRLKEAGVDQ
jgi:hypothetical protein